MWYILCLRVGDVQDRNACAHQLPSAVDSAWAFPEEGRQGTGVRAATIPSVMPDGRASAWDERRSAASAHTPTGTALQSAATGGWQALEGANTGVLGETGVAAVSGHLESTVQSLGGFIEDEMPTFSEFKRVRASRKGLMPS